MRNCKMEMLNVWLIWYVWTELAFFGVKKKKKVIPLLPFANSVE